jgi:hypothetical protein
MPYGLAGQPAIGSRQFDRIDCGKLFTPSAPVEGILVAGLEIGDLEPEGNVTDPRGRFSAEQTSKKSAG